jgi:hypothetical protein
MRRYREFVWLRTHFKLDSKHKERKVPELPPKAVFKSLSDKKFNNERMKGLEDFLQAICTDETFLEENSTTCPHRKSRQYMLRDSIVKRFKRLGAHYRVV